ncbi:8431_t:CDS:1, partial [Funneliformis geosporum]
KLDLKKFIPCFSSKMGYIIMSSIWYTRISAPKIEPKSEMIPHVSKLVLLPVRLMDGNSCIKNDRCDDISSRCQNIACRTQNFENESK